MKAKRILSLLLTFVMVLGMVTVPAFAEGEGQSASVTAYISVSKYGDFVKDKNGDNVALTEVTLSGKDSYSLNDLFATLHSTFCGEDNGYVAASGDYGLYVTKFWGKETSNLGYQINGGKKYVGGLDTAVNNGDCVDVSIYQNYYPNTENYTVFESYKDDAYVNEPFEVKLSQASYDENYNLVFSPCVGAKIVVNGSETEVTTDSEGKALLSFDTAGNYIVSAKKTKLSDENEVTAITAPVCLVNAKVLPDACITAPSDAKLFVGSKSKLHYVKFTEVLPFYSKKDGDNTKYYFELKDGSTYNYRVSGDEYVTYSGKFTKSANFSLVITQDHLMPAGKTKKTLDRNPASNNEHNVADIYLNINPKGFLNLNTDDNYQIVSLRNWQAVGSDTINNYFIEPDYHFEATDINGNPTDVVEIDENGVLHAKKSGTAIVYVTYDAMTVNYGKGDDFHGAIYPENTGVFVVSVDGSDSEIQSGMTINKGKNTSTETTINKTASDMIDSELDCVYFVGEKGKYTFTPETDDVSVSVANPVIDDGKLSFSGFDEVLKNSDGSFSVPLSEGRNIVKLEKNKKQDFQVITAKKTAYTINNGDEVHPGDNVSILFENLYHPVNKLAGIYNMNASVAYHIVNGDIEKTVCGEFAMYDFAKNESAHKVSKNLETAILFGYPSFTASGEFKIPDDYTYTSFKLSGGSIFAYGFGDAFGAHRGITYDKGTPPNTNAGTVNGYMGMLPDIEIPIVITDSALSSVCVDTQNAKTDYFAGDSFDRTTIVVSAVYEDESVQTVNNYTISPEVLTKDTTEVTVTYKDKSQIIPVTVTEPKVTSIEITSDPVKTIYTEGDTFDPTGMVITATYENGKKKSTSDYTYSPKRELSITDTEMEITYTGLNVTEGLLSVTQAITVNPKSAGSSAANNISVYFTLLGDEKHGVPVGSKDTHTYYNNNLQIWVSRCKITVKKNSHAIDVITKALSLNGIPFTNQDNYISEIKGLEQMDNGKLSGWMYTLNGRYTNYGVDEQIVSNNDELVVHYTDDYTAENTGFSSNNNSSSTTTRPSGSGSNSSKTEPAGGGTTSSSAPVFNVYPDVSSEDWYYDAAKFTYEEGLISGTENGFEPESDMTRAMLVTVLWRLEDMPVVNYLMQFNDVKIDDWYTEAVRWATSEKIVSGVNDDTFGTDENITREQLATILYRYSVSKNLELSNNNSFDSNSYTDGDKVSDYAKDAMKWAVSSGIIKGTTENTISPTDSASRAEVAVMIMRFCEGISK